MKKHHTNPEQDELFQAALRTTIYNPNNGELEIFFIVIESGDFVMMSSSREDYIIVKTRREYTDI